MKAVLNYNGKILVNEEIENVVLLIKLGEDYFNNYSWDCIDYVEDLLEDKTNFYDLDEFEIDNPCDDLVYLTPMSLTGEGLNGVYPSTKEELEILRKAYDEALRVFDEDQVKIAVTSDALFNDYNEEEFSLDDFLEMFKIEEF